MALAASFPQLAPHNQDGRLASPEMSRTNVVSIASSGALHLSAPENKFVEAVPGKRRGKSMSRRTGQSGHVEKSGKWWVVRWWMDVPGQEKRALKRARICPVSGAGSLSASARKRRAREIIVESGADTEDYFTQVVKRETGITFREQSILWINAVKARNRKTVAAATIEWWEGCLRTWLNPHLGDLPLAEVNNASLKILVAAMVKERRSPKTIGSYVQVVKSVVGSAVNDEGEQLHPRTWNHDFVDLPIVEKQKQNAPCFSADTMTALSSWKYERERTLFILCGATGLRIGEALGLEIEKHFSPDFRTITIEQKVHRSRVEMRLKTESARRQIDVHSKIAALLKSFAGGREGGFLFRTRNGKPLAATNILRRHLHPALAKSGYVNPSTETHKAGNHAFRRFRNTYLRNRTSCPEGLYKFWMGHADEDMSDHYDKVKEDLEFRRDWAEKCGFGFGLPHCCTEDTEMSLTEGGVEEHVSV